MNRTTADNADDPISTADGRKWPQIKGNRRMGLRLATVLGLIAFTIPAVLPP
ncbi:MAG TPA: hypothetical protein VMJ12_13765 [Candidatus Acidoferrales bacterium]|nr:hypothetical protein [Candidatus Acidoferrales bacterium]